MAKIVSTHVERTQSDEDAAMNGVDLTMACLTLGISELGSDRSTHQATVVDEEGNTYTGTGSSADGAIRSATNKAR